MSYVISREDRDIIVRALNMSAIDDEAAALVLEAMIVKKDAALRNAQNENEYLRERVRQFEMEALRHADQ